MGLVIERILDVDSRRNSGATARTPQSDAKNPRPPRSAQRHIAAKAAYTDADMSKPWVALLEGHSCEKRLTLSVHVSSMWGGAIVCGEFPWQTT